MLKKFPKDDQLRCIYNKKKSLHEAGIAQPKVEPMGHDPSLGKKRMGNTAKTQQSPELSNNWYEQLAARFMRDYGQNIEYAWEDVAVNSFCGAVNASAGIEVDRARLMKAIKKIISDKEERAMKRDALKETVLWLDKQHELELFDESVNLDSPLVDAVVELIESIGSLTDEQYVERASEIFSVKRSVLPGCMRKYRIGESYARQVFVPMAGKLPHELGFRSIDERALDELCNAWSRRQQLTGEPIKLSWSNHPSEIGKVGFHCCLK
jgi:hypothetical protein